MALLDLPPKSQDFSSYLWKDWFNAVAMWSKSPYNKIPQATTANAPGYAKGALYFDLTLNKLRVGGASGWETVTSV